MVKLLRWLGIATAGLIALLTAAVLVFFLVGRSKAARAPDIGVNAVTVPADSGALARGRHLAEAITVCMECHGTDLGGKAWPAPAVLVSMAAPNLTRGQGGIGSLYTVVDWMRAIRHGVGRDGRRLLIMPSDAYASMSDSDLGMMIAYLQSMPPVNRTFRHRRVGVLGGAMIGLGVLPAPVDIIPHDSVGAGAAAPGVTAAYGGYLAIIGACKACHGPTLRGEKTGVGPPPGPGLVDFVANNPDEALRHTMRTGRTPSGVALDRERMPWPWYTKMTDDELEALRLYLRSLMSAPEPGRAPAR